MKKHDFQPVNDKERFDRALEYVAGQTLNLGKKVLGFEMPLDTLALFSHQDDEFAESEKIIRNFGP